MVGEEEDSAQPGTSTSRVMLCKVPGMNVHALPEYAGVLCPPNATPAPASLLAYYLNISHPPLFTLNLARGLNSSSPGTFEAKEPRINIDLQSYHQKLQTP